jgi:ribulose-5-phosphate 4-epimerase/fuculose-1-phosphate aldolase
VRPEDIFVYDIDGTIIENPGGLIPLEWRIHTQIHRDRPDAMCIAHLHGPHARALGVAGKEVVPVLARLVSARRRADLEQSTSCGQ